MPKTKPMPKKSVARPPTDTMSIWDATEEEFELFPDEIELGVSAPATNRHQPDVTHLEHRMVQVESALTQIVSMLENLRNPSEDQ